VSGAPSAEAAPILRAAMLGTACGLAAVCGAWILAGYLYDRLRRR